MKKIYLLSSFILLSYVGVAQDQFFLTDKVSGHVYRQSEENVNINGTPFFIEEWLRGVIYMKDGAKATKFKLRFDAFSNELLFLNGNDPLVVMNSLAGFEITNNAGNTFQFKCGFPAIDKNTERTLYQILQEGEQATLIKLVKKTILTIEEYNKANGSKEFSLSETYYIVKPTGSIQKIKRDRSSLLEALNGGDQKLRAWVEKNRFRCKDEEEMKQVVQAYNDKTYQ